MPYASFVMPVRNGEKYIAKTIKSLLIQTISDLEIIIIDDHSTDSTRAIVNKIIQKDERVKFYNNPGMGVSAARNFGTKKSRGDVIFPTDADDPNKPTRIQITKEILEKTKSDIFYGNMERYYTLTNKKKVRHFQPYDAQLLRYINYIGHPASAFYRKVFDKVSGYDEALKIVEDYDFFLKAQENNFRFCFKNEIVAQYTMHPQQATVTDDQEKLKQRQYWNMVLRKKHQIFFIDIEYVKLNAMPDVLNFYFRENYEIWFGKESIPNRN